MPAVEGSYVLHGGRLVASVVRGPKHESARVGEVNPRIVDVRVCLSVLCESRDIDPMGVILTVVVDEGTIVGAIDTMDSGGGGRCFGD